MSVKAPTAAAGRAIRRRCGEEGVELAVRPSRKQGLKPSFELLRVQPPLSRRLPQPFGNLLPISI
jgi:hypothetical protein